MQPAWVEWTVYSRSLIVKIFGVVNAIVTLAADIVDPGPSSLGHRVIARLTAGIVIVVTLSPEHVVEVSF
jgi:hypothetical protein